MQHCAKINPTFLKDYTRGEVSRKGGERDMFGSCKGRKLIEVARPLCELAAFGGLKSGNGGGLIVSLT